MHSDVLSRMAVRPGFYWQACVRRYAQHLKRFLAHFEAERLLILRSEDFFADPQQIVRQVLTHVRIPPNAEHNARLQAKIKSGEAHKNAGTLWGRSEYTGKMQPTEREKLQRFYRPHNLELYALTGRDFGWEAMR